MDDQQADEAYIMEDPREKQRLADKVDADEWIAKYLVPRLDGVASIRYRAPVAAAHRRAARAVEILDNAGFDDSGIDDVRDLLDWIEGFSSEGVLGLDYATTATLFEPGDLVLDESAAEVHRSLKALDNHDFDQAGRSYAAVAGRWAAAQSLAFSN